MKKIFQIPNMIIVGAAFASILAYGEKHKHKHEHKHKHKHEKLSVHTHGEAQLTLALKSDSKGELSFEVPGMDVASFEHAPETDAEKKIIEKLLNDFKQNAAQYFVFEEKLKCSLKVDEVEWESDDDEEEIVDTTKSKHYSLHAHYDVECAKPIASSMFNVGVFKKFTSIKKLNFQYLGIKTQRATELTVKKALVEL